MTLWTHDVFRRAPSQEGIRTMWDNQKSFVDIQKPSLNPSKIFPKITQKHVYDQVAPNPIQPNFFTPS